MAHSVSEAAARAVKNSQKTKVEERTAEQIIKALRGNLAAKLAVTPSDTAFLLDTYDRTRALLVQLTATMKSGSETIEILGTELDELRAEIVDLKLQLANRVPSQGSTFSAGIPGTFLKLGSEA